jgi:hypothetical protein
MEKHEADAQPAPFRRNGMFRLSEGSKGATSRASPPFGKPERIKAAA